MIFDFPCICRLTSKHVRVKVYHFSINLSRDFHLFFSPCFFADIFHTESLRILAERLSQPETQLPLRQICYYSPPKKVGVFSTEFKSNVRETWRVILVSEADIFHTESLRISAKHLSQSETHLPLRQICYYSPPKEVGVFSTEIKNLAHPTHH